MKICEEMIKLRNWLDEEGVLWVDKSSITSQGYIDLMAKFEIEPQYADTTIHRTYIPFREHSISVINGYGTYGGFEPLENKNYGALEMMIDDNEPVGWLSAENVIQKLEELK